MKFIDRTIPELLEISIDAKVDKITEFASLLNTMGIEKFEIDKKSLSIIKHFPQEIEYIFRINSEADLKNIERYKLKNFIFSVKDNSYEGQKSIIEALSNKCDKRKDIKKILEVPAYSLKDLENYFSFYESNLLYKVNVLRIIGFSNCVTVNLKDWMRGIKLKYNIEIDICAENNHFCATGAAVNALSEGIDYITGSFTGIGGEAGYSPIEEVFMAAKVVYNLDFRGDTTVLQKLKKLFEEITGTIISKDKPIIGSDIFVCESGVHVDGIIKNPKNYEPFEPELVGLKRRIVLGKHSGTTAVECILKQYNINYEIKDIPRLLRIIQERSVEFKSFFDGEALKKLVSELNLC